MTTQKPGARHLIVGLAAVLAVAGCEGPAGPAGTPGAAGTAGTNGMASPVVAITPASGAVAVGATLALSAATTPAPATADTYRWMSSNVAVATVDASGVVTGVAVGTALIVASATTGGATGIAGISVTAGMATGPVSFERDVFPLLSTRDAWYVGGANCNTCHQGDASPGELDLRTYAGLIAGADRGTEAIVVAGNWEESILRRRLRNNRMPFGITPFAPRDGPPVSSVARSHPDFGWTDASSLADTNGLVKIVEAWIAEGAVDGDFAYVDSAGATVMRSFDTHVLPLFTTADVWTPDSHACTFVGCHTGADGAGGLNMGSYAGIIAGADAGTEAILVPGMPDESMLRWRLRNNRMPLGIPTWVPRDGPNGEVAIIGRWVMEGALDN